MPKDWPWGGSQVCDDGVTPLTPFVQANRLMKHKPGTDPWMEPPLPFLLVQKVACVGLAIGRSLAGT